MALRFPCQLKNVTSNFEKLQHPARYCTSFELRCIHFSSVKGVDGTKYTDSAFSDLKLPDEPTNCCMSGCANCVWIKYAEELVKGFDGGSDLARKIILDKIEDPNMRAFLEMELRTLTNLKSR